MAAGVITFYANGATVYEDGVAGTATSVGIRDFPVYAPDPSSFTASVRWVPQTISFEKDGYVFSEWNTAADGTGTSFQIGDLIANSNSSYLAYAVYAIWKLPPVTYITDSYELTSIADAIRAKGGTSAALVYPTGFVSAINDISTGGGQLYVFVEGDSPGGSTGVSIGNKSLPPIKAYYGDEIVSGATVTFYTYGDFILDLVEGFDSKTMYPFTTVRRGTYTFTMPSESVKCYLIYDD
jgi:hypothetical protein